MICTKLFVVFLATFAVAEQVSVPRNEHEGGVQKLHRAKRGTRATRTTEHILRRADTTLPYDPANAASTPKYIPAPIPSLLPLTQVAQLAGAVTAPLTSQLGVTAQALLAALNLKNSVSGIVTKVVPSVTCGVLKLLCTTTMVTTTAPAATPTSTGTNWTAITGTNCLDSTMNDTVINSLFSYGGANTIVYLCPNAVVQLAGPIVMTAAGQTLTTRQDSPDPSTRGTVKVMGKQQSIAVYANCQNCNNMVLSNIIVDGNRAGLGRISTSGALIEMGGNTVGSTVSGIWAKDPRGWSAAHFIEGTSNSCSGSKVLDSQFGPAGSDADGQWADGISMACQGSTVTGNTITDATDGGIVIFGAPGTIVSGNTITQKTVTLLGGINSVDWAPFSGSYSNVAVTGNTLDASTAMIKVGIALGLTTWSNINSTSYRNTKGSWSNNIFTSSGGTGYFGYGISLAGSNSATVTGNTFTSANFGGNFANCPSGMVYPPAGPIVVNPWASSGNTLPAASNYNTSDYYYAICSLPGKITRSSVTLQTK
ncbi:hypothetical protein MNV49_005891 [Pseudohyphozyma bogoriensis]|nr:hypothetical protein MNV49_005891 [Pseudohyphozyma bogoriensis]